MINQREYYLDNQAQIDELCEYIKLHAIRMEQIFAKDCKDDLLEAIMYLDNGSAVCYDYDYDELHFKHSNTDTFDHCFNCSLKAIDILALIIELEQNVPLKEIQSEDRVSHKERNTKFDKMFEGFKC